jgi:hypothetical protein
MLSSGANVILVSSGGNVIIWCYHVMLSSGMITHPFFIFPENFTYSFFYRIEESLSFENVTVVKGDTAMLVCTVTNVGDKSVPYVSRTQSTYL